MKQDAPSTATPGPAAASFATTRWTLVLSARGGSAEARAALGELCVAYWQPVFEFIRGRGREEAAARDLTQEFFARLLARNGLGSLEAGRGRFRSYLLGAVKHFLADMHDRDRAAKRGGMDSPIHLETDGSSTDLFESTAPSTGPPSDHVFDREWAVTLVNRAVERLAVENGTDEARVAFGELKPWLMGMPVAKSQADAARALGWTENAVRVAVHRLRRRFRELVKGEIARTVEQSDEAAEELRYLLEVLAEGTSRREA